MKRFVHFIFQVKNYLPSLSAAIGDYTPQRYVWRMAIGLHTPARFYFAFVYFQHYCVILVKGARNLIHFNCLLNLIEIMALFGLTFVSSTQNYSNQLFFFNLCLDNAGYVLLFRMPMLTLASKIGLRH